MIARPGKWKGSCFRQAGIPVEVIRSAGQVAGPEIRLSIARVTQEMNLQRIRVSFFRRGSSVELLAGPAELPSTVQIQLQHSTAVGDKL